MEINQITLQELGIKIANLEIQNAQLVAQLKLLQEESKVDGIEDVKTN